MSGRADPADLLWQERLAEGNPHPDWAREFAAFALNRVSRTFALNIRVLPPRLRDPVLHAYLYCRMADTIEDDAALPAPEKASLLHAFSALFDTRLSETEALAAFAAFPSRLPDEWKGSTGDWEKILLERAPVVLQAFVSYPAPIRAAISRCVTEMCAGMAEFAEKKNAGPLIGSVAELDRYCYYVAGTVGVMLCDLFIGYAHIEPEHAEKMRALCVSFGLGLQLTNILKDQAEDRERGVSWLPPGMTQEALFAKTRSHLEEALEYSCLIPRLQRRLRLFCLWPLFMAAETLALLATSTNGATKGATNGASAGARLKITRAQVARILLRTRLIGFSNTLLRAYFHAAVRQVPRAAGGLAPSATLPFASNPDTFTP